MKTDDPQMSPRFRQLCSKFGHDCDERLPYLVRVTILGKFGRYGRRPFPATA